MNAVCIHCGNSIPSFSADTRFCCAGCAYVHDLLLTEGLEQFYGLRGSQTLPPVPPRALRYCDYSWLSTLGTHAEAGCTDCGPASLTLSIQGISCMGCVWLMERLFETRPGARRLDVNVMRGELHLVWSARKFDLMDFARDLQRFGYLVGPPDDTAAQASLLPPAVNRRLGLCGAFAMNAMGFSLPGYLGMGPEFAFASWFDVISACTATLALLVGGSYFAERSLQSLRHGLLNIDTPITLGIGAAWIGSMVGWLANIPSLKYFDFVAIFIFLMLAGRWWQSAALEQNRRRLLKSTAVSDRVERRDASGRRSAIPVADIRIGDVLVLKPGGINPVCAVLESTSASLSLEWINGESEATTRGVGQRIPSGALNIGTRGIEVKATETWPDSLLQRLSTASADTDRASPFMVRLLSGYLGAVILLGVIGAFAWWQHTGSVAQALQVMISVFVVSCPCALGVAAPFADDLAATRMQRLGVFVKAMQAWPRLARVRKIAFDKTGTLTMENPVLMNPDALSSLSVTELIALHHLTASNLHPVSRSLFDAIGPLPEPYNAADTEVTEIIGQGVSYIDDANGCLWSLGRPAWMAHTNSPPAHDGGEVAFRCDGQLICTFAFRDALRPDTVSACHQLTAAGYDLHLLSGDSREKVELVGRTVGLLPAQCQSGFTPDAKARYVQLLGAAETLFVGDGANDSLALNTALCGGSPVTGRNFLEHKADFYFLGNHLRFLPALLYMAKTRQRAVNSVFSFAILYNIAAISISLAGHMSPLLAAILMPSSSILTLAAVRVIFGNACTQAVSTTHRAAALVSFPTARAPAAM